MNHPAFRWLFSREGRRAAQMLVRPFTYVESAQFVPRYSLKEEAVVFGLTGGIPQYLALFDDSLSLKQNILRLFFTSSGFLYAEPARYNAIIEKVALGSSRLHKIASKTGTDSALTSQYLKSLRSPWGLSGRNIR